MPLWATTYTGDGGGIHSIEIKNSKLRIYATDEKLALVCLQFGADVQEQAQDLGGEKLHASKVKYNGAGALVVNELLYLVRSSGYLLQVGYRRCLESHYSSSFFTGYLNANLLVHIDL